MMTPMSSTTVDHADPAQPERRTGAAARILRYARRRAGLTQRALAAASGTPQETIARIESGASIPRFDTLDHLIEACGFELDVMPRLGVGVDRSLIAAALRRTPEERLIAGRRAAQGMEWLKTGVRRPASGV